MKWRVEYNNEPGAMDEYFREWWAVTDGVRSFNSSAENEAKWLCDKLNDESPEPQEEMTKYYHRGGGECVEPTMPTDPLTLKQFGNQFEQHIKGKPVTAYCDPSTSVGYIPEDWVEVYQVKTGLGIWAEIEYKKRFAYSEENRRIWIEPKREPHKCQYCGAMTTQPDEQCWNNPKNYRFAEGEDDISNDFHKANQRDFQREAERLYPYDRQYDKVGEVYYDAGETRRRIHILARKMSQEELEAKDREIVKLQDKICDLQNQIFIYKIDNP